MSTNNGYQNIVDVEPDERDMIMPDPDAALKSRMLRTYDENKKRKAGRKWTEAERINMRTTVANMLVRGASMNTIIDHMHDPSAPDEQYVSIDTIRNIVKTIEQEWRDTYTAAINKVKERELAKLDHMEEQAWEAWEQSKQGKTRDQVNAEVTTDRTTGAAKRTPRVTRTTKESNPGDPRYMDIIFKCIAMRIRLYGLDEIRNTGTPENGALTNDLQRRLSKYEDALSGSTFTVERITLTEHHPAQSVDTERSTPEAGHILDTTGSVR